MAKGKKTGGRDIQKGQVLNPRGPEKIHPSRKEMKEVSAKEFDHKVDKYLFKGNKQVLIETSAREDVPNIDLAMCSSVHKAIITGEGKHLGWMLERYLGKPDQAIVHSAPEGISIVQQKPDIRNLTDEQLEMLRGILVPNP